MMSRADAIDAYPGPHERRELAYIERDGCEIRVEVVIVDGEATCEKAEWLTGGDVELTEAESEAAAVKAYRGGGW